jgi:pimeloyl-ACP methyl ester carboxylesterase
MRHVDRLHPGATGQARKKVNQIPQKAWTMNVETINIRFQSQGSLIRGRFFSVEGATPFATLLMVPGFPGNPNDVLGLGTLLVERGIQLCFFNPRGLYHSDGEFTHANTLEDIGAAWQWIQQPHGSGQFQIDPTTLVLGGYSYGGGMAMAYAAQNPNVSRLISIAGNDHGEFARELQRNEAFAEFIHNMMLGLQAPQGPVRFDVGATLQELIDSPDVYGLREIARKLVDRSILLVGGWEDEQVTIEQYLLPLYRTLKCSCTSKVTFQVYHCDHEFDCVRHQLVADIDGWLHQDAGCK